MPNSQAATAGQQIVDELNLANNAIVSRARTPLDHAVADVLGAFLFSYETGTDRGECPSCDTGYCGPHPVETYHEQCSEPVENCSCVKPYLTLALAYLGRTAHHPTGPGGER